jgi:hypothetical protein
MHAKFLEDQAKILLVQERKYRKNSLFEILKISEKKIHHSPNVMIFP